MRNIRVKNPGVHVRTLVGETLTHHRRGDRVDLASGEYYSVKPATAVGY